LGWQIQKDIESFAFDENGWEIRYTCSDTIDTQVLIQDLKRKNADKEKQCKKYIWNGSS
jgi:hypothetical protein